MFDLRPFKNGDAAVVASWFNDEKSVFLWSGGKFSYPLCADDIVSRYEGYKDSSCFTPLTMIDDGRIVGHMTMRLLYGGSNLRFGFVVVDSNLRGKGYGKKLILSALNYAKNNFKVNKVSICVFENNFSAKKCYLSVGFVPTENVEIFTFGGAEWTCRELEKSF